MKGAGVFMERERYRRPYIHTGVFSCEGGWSLYGKGGKREIYVGDHTSIRGSLVVKGPGVFMVRGERERYRRPYIHTGVFSCEGAWSLYGKGGKREI